MRLLYIQSKFGLGGINRITSVKENYLINYGYEVHNLNAQDEDCLSPEGRYDRRIIMHSISLGYLNRLLSVPVFGHFFRYVYYRYKLLHTIFIVNPDVIIATMPRLEPVLVVWLSFWKKRILEIHGWYNHPETTALSWKERAYFFLTSPFYQIVVLTKGESDKLRKLTGCKSLCIPNPQYNYPKQLSTCENKRVISMARFTPQKKLEAVIPFWKMIEDKHQDWELHLYGAGIDENKMKKAIFDNNLKKVFINNYSNNVEEVLAKSSIYILPSMFEGFPLVLLESMASGVPVVAYNCPFGPSEIIKDGEDGIISEYNNPQIFMEKVLYLIEHDAIRKEMGRKARENILRFNIDDIMNRWITLYTKL